ncbi:helix-turn-helix domain-containing protein [Robertkochia solimangrovi]|uniref:helix-turn-helix domain-containing protein n=1 Tax=Robertkochia solimangrovi TaxID=2213046 RepID=UPI0013A53509|nr:AraC family transcriptional regulator [Robertkochia solimangrovi]
MNEATQDTVGQSIAFMNQQISQTLKVEDLAGERSLSVSRYSEIFKKKTGFSAIHYFNKLKIEKSCQYLYFTDMTVKEVSQLFGFDDPYYFTRLFKKVMGIPPSQYRYLYKNKNFE